MLERVSTLDAPASGEHQKVEGTARPSASESRFATVGAWLSLARAPGSGPGGRWFESTRPDHSFNKHSIIAAGSKQGPRGSYSDPDVALGWPPLGPDQEVW